MSEWKEYRLGDVITLYYGKPLPERRRISGSIPVYSSAGITGWHNQALINSKGLIIGRKGTIGKVYKTEVPFFPIDTCYYVLPNEKKYDFYFLFYLLLNLNLEELNEDSAVPGLNRETAYSLVVKLPPLQEQKAIAEILTSLDDKIDLLHRQNKTLEAMAETLFRQWFVEGAEEDWEEGVLGDEFDFIMGQSPLGSTFNEEGEGTPMYQGNRDFGFRFPKARVYTTAPKRFALKFDTLISVRAPVGAQNMANEKCCIGRGVAAFRYKSNSGFYTYTYFKMRLLMNEIKKFNDEGTVFGSIGKSDFEKLKVLLPPSELVEKYQNEVKPIDDKVILNCGQISKLEKLRDTLLPKLMGGEIKVSAL